MQTVTRPFTDTRWFSSTRHRRPVQRGSEFEWRPYGVTHAREAGAYFTACGLSALEWRIFWLLPFHPGVDDACPECAAALSRPTIARVESDSDVTTATLGKIAEALGLTLELKGR